MKENGLELNEIASKVETANINSLKDALSLFNSSGYIVAYLDYKVLIGRVNENSFEFYKDDTIEEKYIQRLRLFNEKKELLIWRDRNSLKGRLRSDDEGKGTFVVDACQVLWGTYKQDLENGWIKLFEERGTELILPYGNLKIDNKKHRLFLKTRNYIFFHSETHQATYTDCRFVGFTDKSL